MTVVCMNWQLISGTKRLFAKFNLNFTNLLQKCQKIWQHCFPGRGKAFDMRHFHLKVVKIDAKFKFWLQLPLIWHQACPLWCNLRHGGPNRGSLWPQELRLSSAVKNTETCVPRSKNWIENKSSSISKIIFLNCVFCFQKIIIIQSTSLLIS